jgi:hypothetical protein
MVSPSGHPVAGATVDLYTGDPPSADALDYTPVLVGSVTTDANGRWSFAVPPYASLPAAAQAVADNNGGILNLDAEADGYATTTSASTGLTTSYDEVAFGGGSAWVGSSSQASAPPGVVATGGSVATFRPIDVTDTSSRLTATNEANTWASLNDPLATDSSGAWTGDPSVSYADPVTDAYGFQEIGGNGTYNPNMTSDGTNLTNVAVVPDRGGGSRCVNTDDDGDWDVKLDSNGKPIKGWSWLTVGEQHAYWDANGWYTYTKSAQTSYSVMESVDGGDFGVSYTASYTSGKGWSTGIVKGPDASYLNVLATDWEKITKTLKCPHGAGTHTYVKIIRTGIHAEPTNANWNPYTLGPSILYQDGPTKWANARYRSRLDPGQQWCLDQNQGVHYKYGAKVFFVSISAETDHSTSAAQCIKEGNSTQRRHHVWGSNDFVWNYPKVMHSN